MQGYDQDRRQVFRGGRDQPYRHDRPRIFILNIIRDYEVVEKKTVTLPDELIGLVKCNNPKCITNNEPMLSRFHVIDKEKGTIKCHYCERKINKEDIIIR